MYNAISSARAKRSVTNMGKLLHFLPFRSYVTEGTSQEFLHGGLSDYLRDAQETYMNELFTVSVKYVMLSKV